jgi:hypothetical protein
MQKLFFQIQTAMARSRDAMLSYVGGINSRGAPCSPIASLWAL